MCLVQMTPLLVHSDNLKTAHLFVGVSTHFDRRSPYSPATESRRCALQSSLLTVRFRTSPQPFS